MSGLPYRMRYDRFKGTVTSLLESRPHLNGIQISLSFHDHRVPTLRDHGKLAAEVIRCVEFVRQSGLGRKGGPSLLCFLDITWRGSGAVGAWPPLIGPYLRQHVSQLDLHQYHISHPLLISCWQAQGDWCSPSADALRAALEKKQDDVRKAVDQSRYTPDGPLWLLVVANNLNDISSFAFTDDKRLKDAVNGSGFDFQASVFEEVWMLEGCGDGRAHATPPVGGLAARLVFHRGGSGEAARPATTSRPLWSGPSSVGLSRSSPSEAIAGLLDPLRQDQRAVDN